MRWITSHLELKIVALVLGVAVNVDVHAVPPEPIQQPRTEGDEQQADDDLEAGPEAGWQAPRSEQDQGTQQNQREGMSESPDGTVAGDFAQAAADCFERSMIQPGHGSVHPAHGELMPGDVGHLVAAREAQLVQPLIAGDNQ